MAVSRVSNLHRFLELQLRSFSVGSRFLSTSVLEPVSSASANALLPPVVEVGDAPSESRDGNGNIVGSKLHLFRRVYGKQVSELRKKYAAEEDRKRKEKMQVERVVRERILVEKEKRLVLKKERSKIRAVEVEEEAKVLRARIEEERVTRGRWRKFMEKRVLYRRAKEKESVRQQSSMWIEEKDLERRIVDALVDPFYLSGSYALPDRDGPMGMDDDGEDEDD